MEFHYFMTAFKEAFLYLIRWQILDVRRLTRLIKFTKGKVEELAKDCIQLPSEVGLKTAKNCSLKDLEIHI